MNNIHTPLVEMNIILQNVINVKYYITINE